MNTGNDSLYNIVHKTECYAVHYEERDPAMADFLYDIARIIRIMDKNQKSLIRLVLKHQRENKILEQIVKRTHRTLKRETAYIQNVWTGGAKNDTARTD